MFIDQPYTLLSIDPGINALGWAISQCSPDHLIVEKFGTLYPTESAKGSFLRLHQRDYSDRVIAGRVIKQWITELIDTHQPTYICSEDAFYNPGRPAAFTALLIAIYSMESQLYSLHADGTIVDPLQAKIYKLPPTTIKMITHYGLNDIGGKAEKVDMTTALLQRIKNKEISIKGYSRGIPPEVLTEHSTDAICIGYAFTKLWKPLLDENILEKKMTALTKAVRRLLKKKKYKSPFIKN